MEVSREEIIRRVNELDEQGYPLLLKTFTKITRITRVQWEKHFDCWNDVLEACGKRHPHLEYDPHLTKEELDRHIRSAYEVEGKDYLGFERFLELSGVGRRDFFHHYPEKQRPWTTACKENGINDALAAAQRRNMKTPVYTRQDCVDELSRVKKLLNRKRGDVLIQKEYEEVATISLGALLKRFDNSWEKALDSVGLKVTAHYRRETPFPKLARAFLKVTKEMGKIPTQAQLARRSEFHKATFARTGKRSYPQFKKEAIEHLLSTRDKITPKVRVLFGAELEKQAGTRVPEKRRIRRNLKDKKQTKAEVAASYEHGETLNFRGFIHAPTYEQEVVGLFTLCARELGFEIKCIRGPHPDCQARRKIDGDRGRYEECLIEFEFRSRDYLKHKHEIEHCDLIVCWEDNWGDKAPIEVLELKTAIKRLPH